MPAGKRIGIFGGAFDPVHLGHVKIADSFLKSHLIDELMVVPTLTSPHKENQQQTSFSDRFSMLTLAFQNHPAVSVSDLEAHLPKPSYTLRTIMHLQENDANDIYFLCIGEDSLATFHTWWRYESILKRVPLIVAKRPGTDSSQISKKILDRALFVDHSEVDVSSTKIREMIKAGSSHWQSLLPEEVADYIAQNGLYRS